MRDIRELSKRIEEQCEDTSEAKAMFRKGTYPDSYGRLQPIYYLNQKRFILLAMGFTGRKALQFKLELSSVLEVSSMHKQVINGKTYKVADTLGEALISWFGEEIGKRMLATLEEPSPPKQKCVYILQMSNQKTKLESRKILTKEAMRL